MKKTKLLIAGLLISLGAIGGALMSPPQTASAQACARASFFGFPAWYKDLVKSDCTVMSPSEYGNAANITDEDKHLSYFIWKIALNVLEIVLRILGIIAVGMMIYGGFLYLTSSGIPERAASGSKTIVAAAVGIVIATSAVAVKDLVWTAVIGTPNDYGVYVTGSQAVLTAVLNTVFFIAGAIAVVMIIISGLNYATSSGSPDKMTKAKNTLLYAVIGLVIVIAAFAITSFVAERFS